MNFHYLFSILLLASCVQVDAMRVSTKLAKRSIPMIIHREIKSDTSKLISWQQFVHDEFGELGFDHTFQHNSMHGIWPSQELLNKNPALLLQDIERWAEAANHSINCLEERLKQLEALKNFGLGLGLMDVGGEDPIITKEFIPSEEGRDTYHKMIEQFENMANDVEALKKKLPLIKKLTKQIVMRERNTKKD